MTHAVDDYDLEPADGAGAGLGVGFVPELALELCGRDGGGGLAPLAGPPLQEHPGR